LWVGERGVILGGDGGGKSVKFGGNDQEKWVQTK